MTIRWPLDLLAPRELRADIAPRSLAAPPSVSGKVQVASSDAGIWSVSLGGIPVVDEDRILAWRAIDMLLEGRLNAILVPIGRFYQPIPSGAEDAGLYDAIPHDDDAYFDDGSGYVGRVIDVVLAGDVAARAVSASVTINYAGTLQPGQHFSIGERMYRLRTVVYSSDTAATITFRPPLREAATSGDQLEFDDPVCRMKLVSDREMALPLDYNRWAFPAVNFVEDV